MSDELEKVRKFCSDWTIENFGKEYDTTPWMTKLDLYSLYKYILGEDYKEDEQEENK